MTNNEVKEVPAQAEEPTTTPQQWRHNSPLRIFELLVSFSATTLIFNSGLARTQFVSTYFVFKIRNYL